jgi:hypothetical protein
MLITILPYSRVERVQNKVKRRNIWVNELLKNKNISTAKYLYFTINDLILMLTEKQKRLRPYRDRKL